MNGLDALSGSRKRLIRNVESLACACSGLCGQGVLLDTIQVAKSQSGVSTEVVLEKLAGCVSESLLITVHELGVGEDIPASAGHVVEAVG